MGNSKSPYFRESVGERPEQTGPTPDPHLPPNLQDTIVRTTTQQVDNAILRTGKESLRQNTTMGVVPEKLKAVSGCVRGGGKMLTPKDVVQAMDCGGNRTIEQAQKAGIKL